MLIGHQKLASFFDYSVKSGSLAHVYCFVGIDGVGKRTLANSVAGQLLGVAETRLPGHPDYFYLTRQSDEKTGKLKQDISIEQARQLKEYAGRRAWLGGWKVVVIDEAEKLSDKAANALLKNLEEAGDKSVFFLLTADEGALPITIRSRCQLFYFAPVAKNEIADGLKRLGYADDLAEEAAKLSAGRPGSAIGFASDEEKIKARKSEECRWQEMSGKPLYFQIKKTEDLLADKDDSARAKDKLQEVFDIWQSLWRDALLANMRARNGAAMAGIARLLDKIKEAKIMLRQNVNPRLAVEQILLDWQNNTI